MVDLEYNVYVDDFNARVIKTHNIFDHVSFVLDCAKDIKRLKNDREAIEERIRSHLMYYYWSKCEWEIILLGWPPREDGDGTKVDVYSQVMMNKGIFFDYVWEHRSDIVKLAEELEKKYENHRKSE